MDHRRTWLAIVFEEAFNLGVLSAEDVLRHMTPAVLATDLPPTLVASLLQTGLDEGSFNSELLVDHLGSRALAEHMPMPVLWSCLNEAADQIVAEHPLAGQTVSPDEAGAVVEEAVVDVDGGPDIEVIEE